MKNILILIGLFHFVSGFAQINKNLGRSENLIQVKKDSVVIFSTNQNQYLKGFHFSFNGKATNIQVDTALDNVISILNLKNGGDYNMVFSYNPDSDIIKWKYRTLSQNYVFAKDNLALINSEPNANFERVLFLDRKSGETEYFIEGADIYQMPASDLLYAFPKYNVSKGVEIIKANTGLVLTRVKIPAKYYFSSSAVNDSFLYLNINGVFALDKNYKKVWTAEINTMQLDVASVLFAAAFGIGIGAMTGYAPIYTAVNYSANLTSDFHFFQKNVFLSDKEKMYSFDKKTGKKNWEQKLPFKTGFSQIHDANDSVFSFLNTGLCTKNGRLQGFCTPYHAIINKRTGQIINYQKFRESSYVSDFRYDSDSLLILFNNRVCKVKANDTMAYNKGFILPESLGEGYFISRDSINHIYILDSIGSKWYTLGSQKRSKDDIIVVTSRGLIIVDRNFNLLKYFPVSNIGILAYENETCQFFEIMRLVREKFVIPGGFVKYCKSDGTSSIFNMDHPYIIDHEKLYVIDKKSFDVYKLE